MSDMDNIAVRVRNVSKTFSLPHEKQTSLKGVFLNIFRKKNFETQKAVKKVSFEVKKGEFFGIVGRNGSGKSTLLKCMAGVYNTNEGKIDINGSLVPFIELGVGFNPELSGKDNVFLNGALLGFSRKQMSGMYKDIVEFAELDNFMDQKLKNYSSGMQVRLAFSIAIRARGDILLLDEVLAVGDAGFQQKCNDYFASLKKSNQTIILVSHNMSAIERYCDRALLIENGEVVNIGPSSKIANMYEDMILKSIPARPGMKAGDADPNSPETSMSVSVHQNGKLTRNVEAFKDFRLLLSIKPAQNIENISAGVNIRNSEGQVVFAQDTSKQLEKISLERNKTRKIAIDVGNYFTNGTYSLSWSMSDVSDQDNPKRILKQGKVSTFTISGVRENQDSLFHPEAKISLL